MYKTSSFFNDISSSTFFEIFCEQNTRVLFYFGLEVFEIFCHLFSSLLFCCVTLLLYSPTLLSFLSLGRGTFTFRFVGVCIWNVTTWT